MEAVNEMSFEDKMVIKNFAMGKEGFKEQAVLVYKKYKENDLVNETIEMEYMSEVLNPMMNYTRKEVLRGKLLNIREYNKKGQVF